MRKIAGLCALLGLLGARFPGNAQDPDKNRFRWSIKTSVPPDAKLDRPGVLVPLPEFFALAPAAAHASDAFEKSFYPKVKGSRVAEGEIVRARGFMRVVAGEE